jgi:hypothetical protein
MKKKLFFLICLLFFQVGSSYSQTIYPFNNFRIYPGSVTQTEPIVCVSPLNPLILFAAAVTIDTSSGFRSEGIYISTNGGLNWTGNDTCSGQNIFNHGGDPGVAIAGNGNFIITHIGSIFYGLYAHYSTNAGANWSSAYTIINQLTEDKGKTSSDKVPGSPYYGRIYTTFVRFTSPFPVMMSCSSNNGINWSVPITVHSSVSRCSGGDVKVGLNGVVYDCWSGVTNTIPYTEDFAGFAYSTNGGVNWIVSQNIFDMNGINGTLSSKNNIRVNGLPSMDIDLSGGIRNGWIYIVTAEKNLAPAGNDPDIIFHYSTNYGISWSQGIRVNQDNINNGKIQYFPAIKVDYYGGINILYYDDRRTSSDSAEVFLSRSTNGGLNWIDYPISGHKFKPKPITGGASSYQGDFISLEFTNNKLIPLWMDDYSGIYQIWTVPVDISTFGIKKIENQIPESTKILNIYPNPFNQSANIRFQLSRADIVTIKIYNNLGKEVSVTDGLVNEILQPGSYEINWNADNLPSGVYFISLSAGKYKQVSKALIIK